MKRKRKRKKLKKRKMLRERKTFTMPVKRLWMMPKITSHQYQYPRLKLLPKKRVSKRNQLVSEISRAMERMAE